MSHPWTTKKLQGRKKFASRGSKYASKYTIMFWCSYPTLKSNQLTTWIRLKHYVNIPRIVTNRLRLFRIKRLPNSLRAKSITMTIDQRRKNSMSSKTVFLKRRRKKLSTKNLYIINYTFYKWINTIIY